MDQQSVTAEVPAAEDRSAEATTVETRTETKAAKRTEPKTGTDTIPMQTELLENKVPDPKADRVAVADPKQTRKMEPSTAPVSPSAEKIAERVVAAERD